MRFLLILLFIPTIVWAQETTLPNRVNVVLGIGQITQGGFNIEGNLFYKRLVFDYSHGMDLSLNNEQLENGSDKDQGLDIQLPWTTGFGMGYRLTDWLNLRIEPKWHKFDIYGPQSELMERTRIGEYTTFTLGAGLYVNWLPFKKKDNALKGIMIVPNFRWWPRISSSLDNNELTYFNGLTQQEEIHVARQIGLSNSPFFYNLSIGYSLTF